MSYILDALRRADAERERDPARGIHAQPAAGAPARSPTRAAWIWPAAALVVLAGAAFAAWQRPAPQPAPLPSAGMARTPAAPVIPVAAAVLPPPPPAPAPVRVVAAPAAAAAPVVLKAPPAAAAKPAAPTAAAAAPAADRILNIAELPPDVQGQLPKLAISGGVHSDNASQRLLIVGGQVVNEGAELASGVVLEQIRPRSAVLRFRGYRYSVGY